MVTLVKKCYSFVGKISLKVLTARLDLIVAIKWHEEFFGEIFLSVNK